MDVREGLACIRTPMAQHPQLDVLELERLTEQGVFLKI